MQGCSPAHRDQLGLCCISLWGGGDPGGHPWAGHPSIPPLGWTHVQPFVSLTPPASVPAQP